MFIELKSGIFVKASNIEAVIDTIDKGVMVYTVNNSFPSELPSNVILDMIKEPDKNTELLDQMLNIMKTQNTPMGG